MRRAPFPLTALSTILTISGNLNDRFVAGQRHTTQHEDKADKLPGRVTDLFGTTATSARVSTAPATLNQPPTAAESASSASAFATLRNRKLSKSEGIKMNSVFAEEAARRSRAASPESPVEPTSPRSGRRLSITTGGVDGVREQANPMAKKAGGFRGMRSSSSASRAASASVSWFIADATNSSDEEQDSSSQDLDSLLASKKGRR